MLTVLLPCIFLSPLVLLPTFSFYVPFALFIHLSCYLLCYPPLIPDRWCLFYFFFFFAKLLHLFSKSLFVAKHTQQTPYILHKEPEDMNQLNLLFLSKLHVTPDL